MPISQSLLALTRLAALGTLSRNAREGLGCYGGASAKPLSRTAGEGGPSPRAGWVRVGPPRMKRIASAPPIADAEVIGESRGGFSWSRRFQQGGSDMPIWKPDPTFYPSPRLAMKAPPETLAFVASFDPTRRQPDA